MIQLSYLETFMRKIQNFYLYRSCQILTFFSFEKVGNQPTIELKCTFCLQIKHEIINLAIKLRSQMILNDSKIF